MKRVAVVGLGYVGLPLALQFARSGAEVVGVDIDPRKIEMLMGGESYIKHIEGSRILIVGLAYKPNVDDDRESPAYVLLDLCARHGAKVEYYDPHVPEIKPTRKYSHWAGTRSIEWSEVGLQSYDCALITTDHKMVDYETLAKRVPLIVDTRNAMHGIIGSAVVVKA